jgi:DNA-binding transcriptional LysR family regulator
LYVEFMTLEQLRVFVAIADHAHVTRAAADLGITQSAASAAIAALEARTGAVLFDRVGRGIELTDTGRRFLPEARAVLDRAAAARSVLDDLAGLTTGALSVAASQTIATYWLPRRLAAFHAAHPGIQLDVTIGNTRQVERSVVEGAADLGLVEGATDDASLTRQQVDRDRLVLVISANRAPPRQIAPGRPDLTAVPWVIREEGSGTREALADVAGREGLTLGDLPVFLVLPSNEAVREAVEAGAGATIISEHVVARDLAAGVLKVVPITLPEREFALVRHRQRHASAAQKALVKLLANEPDDEQQSPPRRRRTAQRVRNRRQVRHSLRGSAVETT